MVNFAGTAYFLAGNYAQGHDLNLFQKFPETINNSKECFFQRKGRKRVKEWREVTFMKEWVKPLYLSFR